MERASHSFALVNDTHKLYTNSAIFTFCSKAFASLRLPASFLAISDQKSIVAYELLNTTIDSLHI